jgi:hypothetical protein
VKQTGIFQINDDGVGGLNVNIMNAAANDLGFVTPSASDSTYLGQGEWVVPTVGGTTVNSNSPYTKANLADADVMLLAAGVYFKDAGALYTRGGATLMASNETLDKNIAGSVSAGSIRPGDLRQYSPGSVVVDTMNEPSRDLVDEEGWYRQVWLPAQWGHTSGIDDDETVINGAYYGGVPFAGSLWSVSNLFSNALTVSMKGVEASRSFEFEVYVAFDVRGYVPTIPQLISNTHLVSSHHEKTVGGVMSHAATKRSEGVSKGLFDGIGRFVEENILSNLPSLSALGSLVKTGMSIATPGLNGPAIGNLLNSSGVMPSTGTPISSFPGAKGGQIAYNAEEAAAGNMPLIEEVFEDSFLNASLLGGEGSLIADALPIALVA